MASQYDSIKTPKELLTKVAMHGLSTRQEDICRAQDIFGRAPIEDLVALANDNGRLDDNGNPDPNGSRSSGRDGTRKYFYQVLFHIWHWEDATRFYNEHTNPEFARFANREDKILELEQELRMARQEADEHHEDCQEWIRRCEAEKAAHADTRKEADFYRAGYDAANMEIIRLKAKLYDLMVAKEEK